jgi:hypothetical protein
MTSQLSNAKSAEFFDFMLDPPPNIYSNWLPDEHHKFHVVKRNSQSPIGDLIYYDQRIGGKYRLNFYATVRVANRTNHIVYQMNKFGINLPGYLDLEFQDNPEGLSLKEEIRIGFNGFGRILDPFIAIFFSKSFFKEMDGHHKREWANLADILAGI